MLEKGLYLFVVPSGYNPFVLIGWLRPSKDTMSDDYEMIGGRVIRRFGADNMELGILAAKGPQLGTELLHPTEREVYHRLCMTRIIPANPKNWAESCPQPRDW